MNTVLAVVDKKGRIQHNRMCLLANLLSSSLDIEVASLDEFKHRRKEYDIIYFAHFSLYDKKKIRGKKATLSSVTSHKCLSDFRRTIKKLKRFDRVSVNNTILFAKFRDSINSLFYTPNGVDTSFFAFCDKKLVEPLVFGWTGNSDRSIKNYQTIVKPLSKIFKNIQFNMVVTSKKDTYKQLKTTKQMLEYYKSLHWFLVASDAEGTPNPFLESHSVGVPAISTPVGNTVEIMEEGVDGFFVEPIVESFTNAVNRARDMSGKQYEMMRTRARDRMCRWDWSVQSKKWLEFLKYNEHKEM